MKWANALIFILYFESLTIFTFTRIFYFEGLLGYSLQGDPQLFGLSTINQPIINSNFHHMTLFLCKARKCSLVIISFFHTRILTASIQQSSRVPGEALRLMTTRKFHWLPCSGNFFATYELFILSYNFDYVFGPWSITIVFGARL